MLTPEYLEYCADDIVRLYSQLDESIIRDITRRIIKTGNISETARWQIEKAQQGGLLYDDVIAEIAKITDATENHIKALFEDAGIKSVEYDNAIYEKAGLPIPPTRMSPVAYQMLAAGANKTTGNLKNLTMTTANTAQSAFINACTMAEMQIESGAFDYKTAIRNAVKNTSKQGTTVLYPSGHTDKLDVAVRRAVLTGVSQTTGQVALQNAKDMDCDLMEITAHSGARPDHAVWQGRIVSLSGQKGYFSLNDIGYGTGAGFKGWNCRHDWFPYFEGISKRAYSEEDLQAIENETITYNDKSYTEYEATQIQRKMERTIRATRRELVGLDELAKNGDTVAKAEFESLSVKLKKQEEKLKDFCNTTDRNINTFKVQVDGFNKSVSRKAVWANKNSIENIKKIMSEQVLKLPKELQNVITEYSGFLATRLNDAIRLGKVTPSLQEKAELLHKALSQGIMPYDVTLVRETCISFLNLGVSKNDNIDLIRKLKGRNIINPIFTSTSFKSLKLPGRDTRMYIKVPKGYKGCQYIKLVAHNKYKYQEEILFDRGLHYKINDAKIDTDGKIALYVEVL